MKNAVIIYSGGMDSFTLLHDTIRDLGHDCVKAVSFNYGQRHSKELEYARWVTNDLHIEHRVVDITGIHDLLGGSSLTDDIEVPEGHYADENMKLTVVPNRNMIMLSIAVGYAVSSGFSTVLFGAHAGDHTIYPDCRAEFIEALTRVTRIANYDPVEVIAPYIDLSKGDIAVIGKGLSLDYGQAWTCYKGKEHACGKCGACQERIEAMEFAGINDPTEYM